MSSSIVYFNNASTTYPKPELVINTVRETLRKPPLENYRGSSVENINTIERTRELIAWFFNVNSLERVIFTSSATESLNLVLNGLASFYNKPHVVASYREHNSVLRPLFHLLKAKKINLTLIKSAKNGEISIDQIKNAIRKETKVLVLAHASNIIGDIIDVDEVSEICRNKNIVFVLDAAQSAGLIPVDLKNSKIDFYIFAGHKNLYGLQGVGGVIINCDLNINPLIVGGTGIRSDLLYQPTNLPLYYESGTPNLTGILSISAGMKYILDIGLRKILEKTNNLSSYFYERIKSMDDFVLYGHSDFQNRSGIIPFNIRNIDPEEIGLILHDSYNIITRTGLHCAPLLHRCIGTYPRGCVRISFSFMNEKGEIDFLVDALKKIHKNIKWF